MENLAPRFPAIGGKIRYKQVEAPFVGFGCDACVGSSPKECTACTGGVYSQTQLLLRISTLDVFWMEVGAPHRTACLTNGVALLCFHSYVPSTLEEE